MRQKVYDKIIKQLNKEVPKILDSYSNPDMIMDSNLLFEIESQIINLIHDKVKGNSKLRAELVLHYMNDVYMKYIKDNSNNK